MKFPGSFIQLILLYIFSCAVLLILPHLCSYSLSFYESIYIVSGCFIISMIIFLIFQRGFNRESRSFLIHTLFAISLKFLLYLAMIGGYFFAVKKLSLEFVITFFVVYLAFTYYTLLSVMRKLKEYKPESK
jgi:hypothetical protein